MVGTGFVSTVSGYLFLKRYKICFLSLSLSLSLSLNLVLLTFGVVNSISELYGRIVMYFKSLIQTYAYMNIIVSKEKHHENMPI